MDHLIPYASKRGKAHAKPEAMKAKRVTRAWKPDPGFTETELRDPAARDFDKPIPRPQPRSRKR